MFSWRNTHSAHCIILAATHTREYEARDENRWKTNTEPLTHSKRANSWKQKLLLLIFAVFVIFFFCFASPSVVFGVVSVSILPCPAIHYDFYNMHATCLNRFVMSLRCAADTIFLCVFPCCCLLLLCLSVCVCVCVLQALRRADFSVVACCRFYPRLSSYL